METVINLVWKLLWRIDKNNITINTTDNANVTNTNATNTNATNTNTNITNTNNVNDNVNVNVNVNNKNTTNKCSILKKRGRKRKVELNDKYKNNDYITMWPEIWEGKKILIDKNNNIYTFDIKNPKYLGEKMLNNKLKT